MKVLLLLLLAWAHAEAARTDVRRHGAKADCATVDDRAFAAALAAADTVDVPAGCYAISGIAVPEGRTLRGRAGQSRLVSVDPGSGRAVRLGSRSRLLDIDLEAGERSTRDGIYLAPDGIEMEVRACRIRGFRYGVHADNVNRTSLPCRYGARIAGCRIEDAYTGIEIDFSRKVQCVSNEITGSRRSAILAWGNYQDAKTPKFTSMRCSDILIDGNRAIQSNRAYEGIWATGCDGVTITRNHVENARDVGIDLEWVHNGTIAGNLVKDAVNGCIALFFACRNIEIRDNVIRHGHTLRSIDSTGWWASAGIWLTSPDRKEFPGDSGHRDIRIVGNEVDCAAEPGFERRGIWVGRAAGKTRVFGNTFTGDCRLHQGDPAIPFSGNVSIDQGLVAPLERTEQTTGGKAR